MSTAQHLTSRYGCFCPNCTAPIVDRERCINGLNTCAYGHKTASSLALSLDDAAWMRFSKECNDKLRGAAVHKGRSGWESPDECSANDLADMLVGHLKKGDMRDVAILAMFLHERREDCAKLFYRVGCLPASPYDLERHPASGGMMEIVVYGETDNVGSKCEEIVEVDRGQWNAASPAEREAWASDQAHEHITWGFYPKEDEDAQE